VNTKRLTFALSLLAICVCLYAAFRQFSTHAGATSPAAPQAGVSVFSAASVPGMTAVGEQGAEGGRVVLTLRNDTGRPVKGFSWYRNNEAGRQNIDARGVSNISSRLFTNNLLNRPLAPGAETELLVKPSDGPVRVSAIAFEGGAYEGEPEAVESLGEQIGRFETSLAALLDDIGRKFPNGARTKPRQAEAFAYAVRSRVKDRGKVREVAGLTPAQSHLSEAIESFARKGKTTAEAIDEFADLARKRLGRRQ
jgi:hypothetical protein